MIDPRWTEHTLGEHVDAMEQDCLLCRTQGDMPFLGTVPAVTDPVTVDAVRSFFAARNAERAALTAHLDLELSLLL